MRSTAARIASRALGDGPNVLSLAPSRSRKGRPLLRSSASGATKGTVAGSPATRRVTDIRLLNFYLSILPPLL